MDWLIVHMCPCHHAADAIASSTVLLALLKVHAGAGHCGDQLK